MPKPNTRGGEITSYESLPRQVLPEVNLSTRVSLSLKERFLGAMRSLVGSSLARNAGWMLGGQVASFGIQAAYFMILARLLGSAEYGTLAGAAALVNIFSQYSGMGSGILFIRYVSPDHSRFREYWGNILLSGSVIGMLVIIALHLTGKWLLGKSGASILVILAIGDCLCGQLTGAAAQVFQTFEQMRTTASLNFLTNILRLALAITMTLAVHRATAWTWAVASLGVSIAACLIAIAKVTSNFGRPTFSIRLFGARFIEGFIFAVSGSTTIVYNDVDKVMLGHYGMTVANGIYSIAYRVVNICAVPISAIHSAALPRFFRNGVNGTKTTLPFARRILKRTAILGALAALGMFLLAPALPRIAGPDFARSVVALRWLCLIPLLRCFHLSAGDAISGAGFQRFRLASQFVAAAGNFGINLYLIPRYSWEGAAWASLLTDGSLGLMNWAILLALMRREQSGSTSAILCVTSQPS
jgi:O-antigen/teichoic acid export membrane protein